MVNFKVKLAGKVISVSANYDTTLKFCGDYLTDEKEDVSVSVSEGDVLSEKIKSDRERELEGLPKWDPPLPYLETLALYRKIAEGLVSFGIILFHGSAIAVDGEVYLFTAKSGTGKSTHTRLWREVFGDRCVMINDDKPLISVKDGEVTVYGTPWNGKHRLGTNASAPLRAICILERGKENEIHEEAAMMTFPEILSQTYRFSDVAGMTSTMATLDKMLKQIKVYRLHCNMDMEAAEVSYNGMKGN